MYMFSSLEEALFEQNYKGIKGVTLIDQGKPGPRVALFAVTHGNEIVGFEAVKNLYQKILNGSLQINGKLFIVIHNIESYQKFRLESEKRNLSVSEFRFLDHDLNRVYSDKYFESATKSREIKRACEIMPLLSEVNYLFDMHSTTSPAYEMLIANKCAQYGPVMDTMSVQRRILGMDKVIDGVTLITHAEKHSVNAIVLEAGSHFDLKTFQNCIDAMYSFLASSGSIERSSFAEGIDKQYYKAIKKIIVNDASFEWAQKWCSFDQVREGDIIATEYGSPIIAEKAFTLLMPSKEPTVGTDGVYLIESL